MRPETKRYCFKMKNIFFKNINEQTVFNVCSYLFNFLFCLQVKKSYFIKNYLIGLFNLRRQLHSQVKSQRISDCHRNMHGLNFLSNGILIL